MKRASIYLSMFFISTLLLFVSCNENDDEFNYKASDAPIVKSEISAINFSSHVGGGVVKTYLISTNNLSDNFTITTKGKAYSIAKAESGDYSDNLTIQYNELTENKFLVFVKYEPIANGDNNGVLIHSAKGMKTEYIINLVGQGFVPSMNVNRTDILQSYTLGGADTTSYVLTASNLQSVVSVNISGADAADYELSKNMHEGYSSSLMIEQNEFVDGDITIYIKLKSATGGDKNATINHYADGISDVSIALNGTVVEILAEPIFVENFDYAVGNWLLNTYKEDLLPEDRVKYIDYIANNKIGLNAGVETPSEPMVIEQEQLSYLSYPNTEVGNAIMMKFNNKNSGRQTYIKNLTEQQDANFVGSYYLSFLIKINSLPGASGKYKQNLPIGFGTWDRDNNNEFLRIVSFSVFGEGNDSPDKAKFGLLLKNNSKAYEIEGLKPIQGSTYLVVIKFTVDNTDTTDGSNLCELFIFQDSVDEYPLNEPKVPLLSTRYDAENVNAEFDTFFIENIFLRREDHNQGKYYIDGIRVGKTWFDTLN